MNRSDSMSWKINFRARVGVALCLLFLLAAVLTTMLIGAAIFQQAAEEASVYQVETCAPGISCYSYSPEPGVVCTIAIGVEGYGVDCTAKDEPVR